MDGGILPGMASGAMFTTLSVVKAPWYVLLATVVLYLTSYICRLVVVYLLSAKALDTVGERHLATVLAVIGRQTPPSTTPRAPQEDAARLDESVPEDGAPTVDTEE